MLKIELNDCDNCLICYESFLDTEIIEFCECHHRFCCECLRSLSFGALDKPLKCPVDRLVVERIFICNSDYVVLEETTIECYRKLAVVESLPVIIREIDEALTEYLVGTIRDCEEGYSRPMLKIVRSGDRCHPYSLNDENDAMENRKFLRRKNGLTTKTTNPEKKISATSKRIMDYITHNSLGCNSSDDYNVHFFDIVADFHSLFQKSFTAIPLKHAFGTLMSKKQFLIRQMSLIIRAFSISKLRTSRQIYRAFQWEHDDDLQTDRCLICANVVDDTNCGKFRQCCHRICTTCIDDFFITGGFCPLHKDSAFDQITFTKCPPGGDFCSTKLLNDILSKKLKGLMSVAVKNVKEMSLHLPNITAVFELFVSRISNMKNENYSAASVNAFKAQVAKDLIKNTHPMEEDNLQLQCKIQIFVLKMMLANPTFSDCRSQSFGSESIHQVIQHTKDLNKLYNQMLMVFSPATILVTRLKFNGLNLVEKVIKSLKDSLMRFRKNCLDLASLQKCDSAIPLVDEFNRANDEFFVNLDAIEPQLKAIEGDIGLL